MYEIGDKVIYQGADKNAYKRVGVLKSIEEKDGKPQLTVEFDNGETFTAPVDDWSREFTNAARNAKFKVGDKVKSKSRSYMGTARIIDETDDEYVVKFESGVRDMIEKSDVVSANACTSTNSVVRNAMAANRRVARNVGDRDMYEDAIRQAIVKCEAAIKYEPDADDYSDVTRLVKQAKDLLAKAYRAI